MSVSGKVVYRHPQGRFEVRERTGRCALGGGTYAIREAVLTPQKDNRGTFHRPRRNETAQIKMELPDEERKPKRLTAREQETAVKMFREKHSIAEIARELARPDSTIRNFLTRHGEWVPKPKNFFSEKELAQAEAMIAQGMAVVDIARSLGRSKDTVYSALRAHARKKNAG